MAFDKYDETRHLGLLNLSICASGFNLFKYSIAQLYYDIIHYNYQLLLYIYLQYALHRILDNGYNLVLEKYDVS